MERITRFRALVLLVLFLFVLGIYTAHMYSLQILDGGNVVNNSGTYTSYVTVKASRGDLMDRNGNLLVGNRASYNLVFNNFVLMSSANPNESLLSLVRLCQELGIEYVEHFPISMTRPYEYIHDQFDSAWFGYFQDYLAEVGIDSDISAPLLIRTLRDDCNIPEDWSDEAARRVLGLRYELMLRADITNLPSYVFIEDVPDEQLNAIMELNIPGLDAEVSTVREYHTKFLAHILGSMTKISSTDWPIYQEKGYPMDAEVGLNGLELAFEDYLHGIDGQLKRTVDAEGNVISEYYTKLPVAGHNVETTLDLNLQIAAEEAMAYYIENLRLTASENEGGGDGHDAEGGAVVVLDVDTFEVLACASYPTYDLSRYRESAYYAELMSNPLSPVYNRALQATYPPGSTYKMCTSVAAMENGLISRYTTLTTKGIYTKYDGAWGPTCLVYSRRGANHGTIDVAQALSVSCNYFFYMVGDMLETAQLDATAKAFGLGEHTGVELKENIGSRANPETKAENYSNMEAHWYPGDKILAAIGQSENRFTPMQMASYIATVANGGTRYACTFLKRVVAADYSTLVEENTPEVLSVVEMAPDTHAALVDGMKLVTTTGTASGYFIGYPITVAGKTGTAEHGSGGSNHGAFACFAPADDPEIAIFVYVEKSGTGGYLSNVAKAIMDVYFSQGTASEMITHENRIG